MKVSINRKLYFCGYELIFEALTCRTPFEGRRSGVGSWVKLFLYLILKPQHLDLSGLNW